VSARSWAAAWLAAAPLASGCVSGEPRRIVAEATIDAWSSVSRLAAARVMEQYGPPDELESSRFGWRDAGPFARIVVWDHAPLYASDEDYDLILHSVRYEVPVSRRELVERLSDRLIVDPGSGELAARSDSLESNLLLLNLADDVAQGRRDLAEAKAYMATTVRASASGRSSPYLERLMFRPSGGF